MEEEAEALRTCRRHGFERPFDVLQVTSWFLFLMFIVIFYLFSAPFLRSPANIIVSAIYGEAVCASIWLNILSTKSDASGPGIFSKLDEATLCARERLPGQASCYICRATIDNTSKHCKKCNKCVVGFDHHCKWLNNCIGMH